jgi:hypothetical protein
MASFLSTRETHSRAALKPIIFFVDEYNCAVVVQDGLHNPDCRILGPGQTRFLAQGRDVCAPVFRRIRWNPAHASEINVHLSSVRATHHSRLLEFKSPSRINDGGITVG